MNKAQITQDICDAAKRADDPYVRAIAQYLVANDQKLAAAAEAKEPELPVTPPPPIIETPEVTPSEPAPATETPTTEPVADPPAATEPAETEQQPETETPIGRSGLEFPVVQLLMGAGFDTVEELRAELAAGYDLTTIDGITPEIAEAIQSQVK